ncbi:helix-turn-helix domain-containing protein [Patescibacteria group bacterium]|nr:helix-turn-helix domain-containing protein [Patescibacteria group bacterium]MBU1472336.1 helix-turn-helix domain-containing protein [Patescibacteria group bacterium]MBU2460412.1 helix-turn-helix domain-containing protein [Patescibacteria group bacterium]MBU2544505.1 helix-turn-helix domain-containing protein [Patescibacteria group bacterium]
MNDILTVKEAAQFLKKYPGTIRRWIIKKKLRARKIEAGGSGVFVILKNDLLEFALFEAVRKESGRKPSPKHPETPPSAQVQLPI